MDTDKDIPISSDVLAYFSARFEKENGVKAAPMTGGQVMGIRSRVKKLAETDPAIYTTEFFRGLIDYFLDNRKCTGLSAMLSTTWLNGYIAQRSTPTRTKHDIRREQNQAAVDEAMRRAGQ